MPQAVTRYRFQTFIFVLLVKLFATWFAINVFAKVSTLGDAEAYVNGAWTSPDWFSRTHLIGNLAFESATLFGATATYYLFSALSALGIWIAVSQLPLNKQFKLIPFYLLPSTSIWTSIPSKECLSGFGICLVLAWWTRKIFGRATLISHIYLLIGLATVWMFRPHYAVSLTYLVLGTAVWTLRFNNDSGRTIKFGIGKVSMGLGLGALALGAIAFSPLVYEQINTMLNLASSYFLEASGRANRFAILDQQSSLDFWGNLGWILPIGIIGPLPSEVVSRLEFLPSFVEGLFVLAAPFVIAVAILLSKNRARQTYVAFIVLPMMLLLMLVHAPFGLFNPGAAIRYRAGFEWLFLVPVASLYFQNAIFRHKVKKVCHH